MRDDMVIIIDSGIDTTNSELMKHVVGGCGFTYQAGVIGSDNDINDYNGHGTNCADLILQMNRNIQFYIMRIVNEAGLSYSVLMLEALRKCAEIPARIICMSLSVTTKSCDCEDDIYTACQRLNQQGKLVCISENNDMEGSEPARFDQVIGVRAFYGNPKNTWTIHPRDDIQVITDGNPVFLLGKSGNYNFFKGCSKANAYFASVIAKYQQHETFGNMTETLTRLEADAIERKEDMTMSDLGIGAEPENEEEEQLEKLIQQTITEVSGCRVKLAILRQLPIMCQITGISFFNFYELIKIVYQKLELAVGDFHRLDADDICTLYRLRKFLKERIRDEEKKQSAGTTGTV